MLDLLCFLAICTVIAGWLASLSFLQSFFLGV